MKNNTEQTSKNLVESRLVSDPDDPLVKTTIKVPKSKWIAFKKWAKKHGNTANLQINYAIDANMLEPD